MHIKESQAHAKGYSEGYHAAERDLYREVIELRKTLIEQTIEADTMRKHHQTVEALLFEAQTDTERLDWVLSHEGRYWLSFREDIDREMEEAQ